MIEIEVPGFKTLFIKDLVLDYNGTLAIDGIPIRGIKEKLHLLSQNLDIHVITADTHGTVKKILQDYKCRICVIHGPDQSEQKQKYVQKLGSKTTAAIGNGLNDSLMLKEAEIGISVIMAEGCCSGSIINSDIVVQSIIDGIDLFLRPTRIIAGLRNA